MDKTKYPKPDRNLKGIWEAEAKLRPLPGSREKVKSEPLSRGTDWKRGLSGKGNRDRD